MEPITEETIKSILLNVFLAGIANLQLQAHELLGFFDNWYNDNKAYILKTIAGYTPPSDKILL